MSWSFFLNCHQCVLCQSFYVWHLSVLEKYYHEVINVCVSVPACWTVLLRNQLSGHRCSTLWPWWRDCSSVSWITAPWWVTTAATTGWAVLWTFWYANLLGLLTIPRFNFFFMFLLVFLHKLWLVFGQTDVIVTPVIHGLHLVVERQTRADITHKWNINTLILN